MRNITCPYCSENIKPKSRGNCVVSALITLILLCFYIWPGVLYAMWVSGKKECPECKMRLG